jgi:hypothetical protein
MMTVLGGGLAGSSLHHRLTREGIPASFCSQGETNTPPVGFVHLFQGRTFHRTAVEVEAFLKAVEFWRRDPLAREWTVRRSVKEGDRLHRSAHTESVPEPFRPREVEPYLYQYGPGFTVASVEYVRRMQAETGLPQPALNHPSGVTIHATGLSVQELLPDLPWDVNPGRTVEGSCPLAPEVRPTHLTLHQGLHMGGNPHNTHFTLGGRVNSRGEAKDDEAQLASSILGREVELNSEWWGKRVANALDRWPLIGWLTPSDFVFAGFGGRALFWLPYCVEVASEAIMARTNSNIPAPLRADRFRATTGG